MYINKKRTRGWDHYSVKLRVVEEERNERTGGRKKIGRRPDGKMEKDMFRLLILGRKQPKGEIRNSVEDEKIRFHGESNT